MFTGRRILVFILDICLIASAYFLSFLFRFDFSLSSEMMEIIAQSLAIVLAVKATIFLASGLYRNIWRYASLQDAVEIFKVVTLSTILSAFALLLFHQTHLIPRSIYLLDGFLLFFMMSSSRLVWRMYRERCLLPRLNNGRCTLIVGAGEAGNLLLKEIRKQSDSPYHVIGFVDDDGDKQKMRLAGVPVLGTTANLRGIIRKHAVEDVIIAIPSANGAVIRNLVDCCKKTKVRFKTLPSITGIIDGRISVSHIKDVEIEDLLGRATVTLDEGRICEYLSGKRVLVTGAAGSIGSEICRQVAAFGPAKLILFDNAETPLYHIEKELSGKYAEFPFIPVLGDIRHRDRVEEVLGEFLPDVVFHAAAYKHVPMMEYNPAEAVTNNILGTKILADAAHRVGVRNFVMISTDKAVNPTNVMGASKRTAEIYVQALARKSGTNFTTVRFGNVLGSNGSVIPLFKEQIRNGGPVTVTDARVIRYFMTIPEACQLVLQAGCIGNGGEIFVLDMGEPVRILDLAEELIRLSGFVPNEDIDIIFTGLRPGEKLFEELLIEGEGTKPTSHGKIHVLESVAMDLNEINGELAHLFRQAQQCDITGLLATLRDLVPEFTPRYSFDGQAPPAFQRVRPDLFPLARKGVHKVLSLKKLHQQTV